MVMTFSLCNVLYCLTIFLSLLFHGKSILAFQELQNQTGRQDNIARLPATKIRKVKDPDTKVNDGKVTDGKVTDGKVTDDKVTDDKGLGQGHPNRLFQDLAESDLFQAKIGNRVIRYGQTIWVDGMLKKRAVRNLYRSQFRYQFYGYRIKTTGKADIILDSGVHAFLIDKDSYQGKRIPYDRWIRLKCRITDSSSQAKSGRYLVQVDEFQRIEPTGLPASPSHPKVSAGVLSEKNGKKYLETKNGPVQLVQKAGRKNERVAVEVFGDIRRWKGPKGELEGRNGSPSKKWHGSLGAKMELEGLVAAGTNQFEVHQVRYLEVESLVGQEVVFFGGEARFPKRVSLGGGLPWELFGSPLGNDGHRPCVVSGKLIKSTRPQWYADNMSDRQQWYRLEDPVFLFQVKSQPKTVGMDSGGSDYFPIFDSLNRFSDGVLELRHQYHYIGKPPFPPLIYGYRNANWKLIWAISKRDSPSTRTILRKRLQDPGRTFEVKLLTAGILATLQDPAGKKFLLRQLTEKKDRSDDIFLILAELDKFRWSEKPSQSSMSAKIHKHERQGGTTSGTKTLTAQKTSIEKVLASHAKHWPVVAPVSSKLEAWMVDPLKKILFRHPDLLEHSSEFLQFDEKGALIDEDPISPKAESLNENQLRQLLHSNLLIALVESGDPEVTGFLIRLLEKVRKRLEVELNSQRVNALTRNEDWYGYPLGRLTDRALRALAWSKDRKAIDLVKRFAMMDLEDVVVLDDLLIPNLAKHDVDGFAELCAFRLGESREFRGEWYVDYLLAVGKEHAEQAVKKQIKKSRSVNRPYAQFLVRRWNGETLETLLESESSIIRWLAVRELSKKKSEHLARYFFKKLQKWEPNDFEKSETLVSNILLQSIENCVTSDRSASIARLTDLMEIRWRYFGLPESGREIRRCILKNLVAVSGESFPFDQQLWKQWYERKYPKRSKVPN